MVLFICYYFSPYLFITMYQPFPLAKATYFYNPATGEATWIKPKDAR